MAVTIMTFKSYDEGKLNITKDFIALQKGDVWEDGHLCSQGEGCVLRVHYHTSDYVDLTEYDANDPRWLKYLFGTMKEPGWESEE